MALPPTHRFDHEPIYILDADLAWDNDRIEADKRLIEANAKSAGAGDPIALCHWQTFADHPVDRYQRGKSRCDLSTVIEWLLPNVEPTKFRLRRLEGAQYRAVDHLYTMRLIGDARHLAVKLGLRQVTGLPGVDWADREREPPAELTDHQIDQLTRLITNTGIAGVGEAVWVCSQTLFCVGTEGA